MSIRSQFIKYAENRTLVMDGAMGAMLQAYPAPAEALCISKPEIVTEIHEAYLEAGADIAGTCTFNATSISLAEFGMADRAYELSLAAAKLARKAADKFSTKDRLRFVAGSMGPTAKSASFAPDMNNPLIRAVTWDELEAAYYDNARGLLDGGTDIFLVETIIDPINAKAAIHAILRLGEERMQDLPIIVSASIMEKGGRLLSGQTLEAFFISTLHAKPLAIGLNCSFGAEKMEAHLVELSAKSLSGMLPALICAYPNAGLPNHEGTYDEDPNTMAGHIESYLKKGIVNIVGGCCGSTPAHIKAIAEKAAMYKARSLPAAKDSTGNDSKNIYFDGNEIHKLSGPLNIKTLDINSLINNDEYEEASDMLMDHEDEEFLNINVDGIKKESLVNFLNYALQYPSVIRMGFILSGSAMENIEAALKCLPGKSIIQVEGIKAGSDDYIRLSKMAGFYAAAVIEK